MPEKTSDEEQAELVALSNEILAEVRAEMRAEERDNLGRDIAHSITIDEDTADDGPIFAAFCTDACGWVGAWHHACDFDDGPGARRAEIEAEVEGQDHLDGCAA